MTAAVAAALQATRRKPMFVAAANGDVGGVGGPSTITYPAGVQDGDLLVLFVFAAPSPTTPAGWTQSAAFTWASTTQFSRVYTRTKVAGDTSVALPAGAATAGILVAYRGSSHGTPTLGTIGTFTEAGGTTLVNAAITPADSQSVILGWVADFDTGVFNVFAPFGWASRSAMTANGSCQDVSEKFFGSTASTGTATWSQDNTAAKNAVGLLIEIKP